MLLLLEFLVPFMPRCLLEMLLFLACLLPTSCFAQAVLEASPETSTNQFAFIAKEVEQHIGEGNLVGAVTWISQGGKVVHCETHGLQDRDRQIPMERDTIFRIYSFTKSITSAAALMLLEEGKYQLDDPVAKYLPEFADQQVYDADSPRAPTRPMTVRDLFLHTSGIIYPNKNGTSAEKLWHEAELSDIDTSLEEFSHRVAQLPLEFSPGERWKYGMSIDLLGRLIEVWSGQKFEEFLQDRIFAPLDMDDTAFFVPPAKLSRLATNYNRGKQGKLQAEYGEDKEEPRYVPKSSPARCSPGGGLFSTADNYGKFLQMILAGGQFDGKQYLKPETVALMSSDQLPEHIAGVQFGDEIRDGFKFGLGFNVITKQGKWDPDARVGEFGWGGAASCHYWVLPSKELIVITLESTTPYSRSLELLLKGKIYQALD